MQIELTPRDFAVAVEDEALQRDLQSQPVILGDEEEARLRAIYEAVPRALARRIREIVPSDFSVMEIQIKITFSGAPLGIGIAGDALVKFAPK